MEIKIQKNVPIPARSKAKTKYPFEKMTVGDSFAAPVKPQAIYTAARKWLKESQTKKMRFVVRPENEGSRCWRTE